MRDLVRSKTSAIWYTGTSSPKASIEVVPAGNRVCLRAYASYHVYALTAPGVKTGINFRTTSSSSTIIFSDIVPQISWVAFMAPVMVTIEIPGNGVLFDDGLFIELEQLDPLPRTLDMKTLLQVVYS